MSKKNSNLVFILISIVMILFISISIRVMKVSDIITQLTLVISTFIISFIVYTLLYELGKFIFGKACGYKFVSFKLLSGISFKGNEGKTKRGYSKSYFRNIQLLMNKENNKDKKSAVLYNVGGSIFLGIFVVAFFVTAILIRSANVKAILIISAITNLFVISQNLIPLNTSTSNDGSYLKAITSSDESLRLYYVYLDYMNHICKYKPTEFDFKLFTINEEFNPINPTHAYAYLTTIQKHIYTRDFHEAFNLIQEKDSLNSLFIEEIMYELRLKAIFLKTMLNNDTEALDDRDNLDSETKDIAKGKTVERAIENYAFNKFSSMDEYASEEAYNIAIKLFEKAPYDGLVKEQKEFLDFLKIYRFTKNR